MKSGVNFINLFMGSFYAHRSQKCKKLLDLIVFFVLFRSEGVKVARKIMVKLTPGVEDLERRVKPNPTSENLIGF